jgi:ABC-type Na+ efflux pump permease subunit
MAVASACSLAAGIVLTGVFEDLAKSIAYTGVYAWAGLTVVVAALQASRSIAQERTAGTWDALIMSPLGAKGIVFGKLFGVLLPLWAVGLLFLLGALPMALVSDDPLAAGLYLLIACCVAVAAGTAAASLGLYCSMRCRTIMSAQLLTIGLGVAIMMFAQCGAPLAMFPFGLLVAAADPVWGLVPAVLFAVATAALPLLPGFILLWYLLARFDRLDGYHRGTR